MKIMTLATILAVTSTTVLSAHATQSKNIQTYNYVSSDGSADLQLKLNLKRKVFSVSRFTVKNKRQGCEVTFIPKNKTDAIVNTGISINFALFSFPSKHINAANVSGLIMAPYASYGESNISWPATTIHGCSIAAGNTIPIQLTNITQKEEKKIYKLATKIQKGLIYYKQMQNCINNQYIHKHALINSINELLQQPNVAQIVCNNSPAPTACMQEAFSFTSELSGVRNMINITTNRPDICNIGVESANQSSYYLKNYLQYKP